MENFTNVNLTVSNLDRYFIRKSILENIELISSKLTGELIDIGCGKMPYKNYILKNSQVEAYIGLDIETAINYDENIKPDFYWDGITMPFDSNSFDCALATEVLEHCPEPEVVLKEIYRILKTDSIFFFTVPFLWNLHEVPHDEYRYTPFSLKRHLMNAGFEDIEIKATGGWHASMAQMLGLWARRSPMTSIKRKILSYFLKPVIRYLIKMDQPKNIEFTEGQMITGLTGTAKKKV
ncbi:class I SAM-dependent methyltransferase [Christiangramia sediminis]|uniref:Class I SAM-dependent methyltransferase n=1 Tax=Christiangramia sediminis TaxID=2881336 RepID=A0A9X1RY06_9FLAO|nr:class I SAM-dependent methyltransferase [Christiangramia sediminis]MCB7481324.1 class I SAM-dependent methyltransferase [Christiangramia sediminis]